MKGNFSLSYELIFFTGQKRLEADAFWHQSYNASQHGNLLNG